MATHTRSAELFVSISDTHVAYQNPTALTFQQQKDISDHTYNLLTEFNNGIPPKVSG